MCIFSFSNTSQFYKSLPYPAYDLLIGIRFNGFKFISSITNSSPIFASPVESEPPSNIPSIYSWFLIKIVLFSPYADLKWTFAAFPLANTSSKSSATLSIISFFVFVSFSFFYS